MAWTHKHVRFQPTINANRKRCRTTLTPNGPTIGANSPQTTARTHTPCQRTAPERGGRRIDCPISASKRISGGGGTAWLLSAPVGPLAALRRLLLPAPRARGWLGDRFHIRALQQRSEALH